MSDVTWTVEDMTEFDRLTNETGSRDQVKRINARLDLRSFVEKHGKLKCDAMFAEIKQNEAQRKRRAK